MLRTSSGRTFNDCDALGATRYGRPAIQLFRRVEEYIAALNVETLDWIYSWISPS